MNDTNTTDELPTGFAELQKRVDEERAEYFSTLPDEARNKLLKLEQLIKEIMDLKVPLFLFVTVPQNGRYDQLQYNNFSEFKLSTNSFCTLSFVRSISYWLGAGNPIYENLNIIERFSKFLTSALQKIFGQNETAKINRDRETTEAYKELNKIYKLDFSDENHWEFLGSPKTKKLNKLSNNIPTQ